MSRPMLTVFLLLSCLCSLFEANPEHSPRMKFSHEDASVKRIHLPVHLTPVQILLEGESDTVITAIQNNLISVSFQNPLQAPVQRNLLWEDCIDSEASPTDCSYNITLVHKRKGTNLVFVCGINSRETLCCDVDLSQQSPKCVVSDETQSIQGSIRKFSVKEGEPSVLVESDRNTDLYTTYSGSQEIVGIYKFGANRVGPANQNKEQHYVGLVVSRQKEDPLQDKVFAFYKEKNRDTALYSGMWLPFVTQVCMADKGGPKKHMQFSWTSQMNARLFCGDPASKQHYSELVHVAAVHEERWQDTRVYALFRNEWGMSAVCVYTIKNFHDVFANSPFKGGSSHSSRPRVCVPDSTKTHLDILQMIEENSEMEDWVQPLNNAGPILVNHHKYTHIYVDGLLSKRNRHHPVLFLSLYNGPIHKAVQNENQTILIAEYQLFNHSTHVQNMILNPITKKLYANSRSDLVQVDVAKCAQYGDHCQDCVLARDPYCSWNEIQCILETPDGSGTVQDVAHGKHAICPTPSTSSKEHYLGLAQSDEVKDPGSIDVPSQSKYFLECPVSSRHAKYTWSHPGGSTPCSLKEQQCLHLIDSMALDQEGVYKCESVEKGYSKVVAEYRLNLKSRAATHSAGLLVWVCLMVVLLALNK
ncbi:semaphorin-7A-like [Cheilinus undulatus]|uniref:semaphorin-7A-like n=1 Tax=Cheilinus undulatus TaxID=241271 RepID=UPI001BD56BC8|nr:semaphorin-7A-like [Cheilinus undulatus]